jgi:hypothetical protein
MVEPFASAKEDRAGFFGAIAHGDDNIELLPSELVHRLRTVVRDIYIDFRHHLYGVRIQADRVRAGTENREALSGHMPQKALSHLASCGVTGADD